MKHLFLPIILFLCWNISFSQITGLSVNLCPYTAQYYVYTSDAGCDAGNWYCVGCSPASTFTGSSEVSHTGTNPDGTVWAQVQWDDVATGYVQNTCGKLNVTILPTAMPTISTNANGLCGTGHITLTATVSSTANISYYVWNIIGSGFTQSGEIHTSANTLNLTYENWTPTSGYAPTIGVGTYNTACAYFTGNGPNSPLTIVPGSVAGLNNVTLNNTTPIICSGATFTVNNQPSGSTLNWSTGNSSLLSINSSGVATRTGSTYGGTTVSVYASNACGTGPTQTANVHVGQPNSPGPLNINVDNLCKNQDYGVGASSDGAANWSWWSNNPSQLQITGGGAGADVLPLVNTPSGTEWSFSTQTSNICGSSTVTTWYCNVATCGRGGNIVVSPNPAVTTFSVTVVDSTAASQPVLPEPYEVDLMDKNSKVLFKAQSNEKNTTIPVENLPNDTYYVNVHYKGETIQQKVVKK